MHRLRGRRPNFVHSFVFETAAFSYDGKQLFPMMENIHPSLAPHKSGDEIIARAPVLEERSSESSPLSGEDWEEWMKWDGAADALVSQQPIFQSDMSTEQDRPPLSVNKNKMSTARLSPVPQPNSKKRKSTDCTDDSPSGESGLTNEPRVARRSHTVIEKRYRTNLNQKIAALRDSVPSLRGDHNDTAQKGVIASASKLNKATVLSKAMEYIQQLERRNGSLEKENANLRSLPRPLKQIDEIYEGTVRNASMKTKEENSVPNSQAELLAACDTPPSATDPQGMIRVPQHISNLRASASQEHYAASLCNENEASPSISPGIGSFGQQGTNRSKVFSKLMVGSLAGLLIMEGFSERETNGDHLSGRGLFALPSVPYSYIKQFMVILKGKLAVSTPVLSISPIFKLFLLVSTLAYCLFLYLFSSKPKPSVKIKATAPAAAPSLASPIEVRRKAWLTAIQTVGVPRHRMFPELIALHLEAIKYVLIQLVGWPGYAWLTGRTEEDEIARVRAWDIAIDAQLTGGDSEVSKSRLVLTIFASGTLPSTPARLMLKALHIRILLWEAKKSGWSIWCILHKAAAQLARQQWLLAQEIQNLSKDTMLNLPTERETLPAHLSALLQLDSDELFTDNIVQRAYNLAWNRPTSEDTRGEDIGIDIVVEDYAIRSPLDALAAWASSIALQTALLEWYEEGGISNLLHKKYLELALHIAPPASSAYARALAARGVFFETNRESDIAELLLDFLPSKNCHKVDMSSATSDSVFVDSSIPERVRNDIVRATKCTSMLDLLREEPVRRPDTIDKAVELLVSVYLDANDKSLLCFAAAHQLLLLLLEGFKTREVEARLKVILLGFRSWLDEPANRLDDRVRVIISAAMDGLVPRNSTKRGFSDGSNDTGYESMSEESESDLLLRQPRPNPHLLPERVFASYSYKGVESFSNHINLSSKISK